VSEITNDEHLEAGGIYLAPGGFHAELRGHQGGIKAVTTEAPLVHGCRPSVDVCFKSALKLATLNPIIVMLTGMGRDGAENTKLLHERGATVIVQDEATSVVWGMPGAVVECNAADYILPLPEIGSTVSRLIHKIKREGKAVSHEQ
jgi:two-component system chemotaxis response regulator CheB